MIRAATAQDLVRIAASRGDAITEADARPWECIVCEQDGAELLINIERTGGVAEVHLYCPPKSKRKMRQMIDEFFAECQKSGIITLVTATDKRREIDSFVEKLGFKFVCEYNNQNVYRKELA